MFYDFRCVFVDFLEGLGCEANRKSLPLLFVDFGSKIHICEIFKKRQYFFSETQDGVRRRRQLLQKDGKKLSAASYERKCVLFCHF